MPLTDTGKRVLASMRAKRGAKAGTREFYASINSGRLKRSAMEGKKKSKKK